MVVQVSVQIIITQFGSFVFTTSGLNLELWLWCIFLGSTELIVWQVRVWRCGVGVVCVCVCVCVRVCVKWAKDCVDLKEVVVSGCVQQCEGIKPLDTAHTSVHCSS